MHNKISNLETLAPPASQGSRTVDKAIDLIVALAGSRDGMTNLELSRELKMDKSTSHRLLTTLERRGFVRRDGSRRRFLVGLGLVELALGSAINPAIAARPLLHRLVALIGESASFSLLVDTTFVCVDSVHAPHEMRFAPEVGHPYPLNVSATGKAMLAFNPELADRVLAVEELARYTGQTVVSPQRLRDELEAIRTDGYAMSEAERVVGGCSIASPVFLAGDEAIGAVAVSAVTARCPPSRLRGHADAVRQAAQEVSASLLPAHPGQRTDDAAQPRT